MGCEGRTTAAASLGKGQSGSWGVTLPLKKKYPTWTSHRGSEVTNPTSIHKDEGSIPGLARGLRILRCRELWCRSKTGLGSCMAVAVV